MSKRPRSTRRRRCDADDIAFARSQRRRANEFSQQVWQIVRDRGCRNQKFRREYPIPPYTADFCCVELKLIVEVDGQDHQTPAGREHDIRRDSYLAQRGFTVLRIPGFQVLRDPRAVRGLIENAIDQRNASAPSPPAPLPQQAEGEGSQEGKKGARGIEELRN